MVGWGGVGGRVAGWEGERNTGMSSRGVCVSHTSCDACTAERACVCGCMCVRVCARMCAPGCVCAAPQCMHVCCVHRHARLRRVVPHALPEALPKQQRVGCGRQLPAICKEPECRPRYEDCRGNGGARLHSSVRPGDHHEPHKGIHSNAAPAQPKRCVTRRTWPWHWRCAGRPSAAGRSPAACCSPAGPPGCRSGPR